MGNDRSTCTRRQNNTALLEQVRREMCVLQMEKEEALEKQLKKHKTFEMYIPEHEARIKELITDKSFQQVVEKCRAFPW